MQVGAFLLCGAISPVTLFVCFPWTHSRSRDRRDERRRSRSRDRQRSGSRDAREVFKSAAPARVDADRIKDTYL